MFRIVAGALALIVVIVVMVLNLSNTTDFNLFGFVYSDIPVYVVSLISFALGVVYTLAYCVGEKIRSRRKRKDGKENAAVERGEPPQQVNG